MEKANTKGLQVKATFKRTELAKAIAACQKITPRISPKAILQCACIRVAKGKATIEATDLESTHVRIGLDCEDPEDGGVAIDAGLLADCVSLAVSDTVTIKADETCTVKTSSVQKVPFEDADKFPSAETLIDDKPCLTIEPDELKRAIHLTGFAVARESARYAMTGVNFDLTDKPTVVGSDGKRLAAYTLDCDAKPMKGDHVIPVEAIGVVCSLAKEPVEIRIAANCATFTSSSVFVYARKVEGRFPAWREVFPKKCDHKLPLDVAGTMVYLRQAAIPTNDDTRGVDMVFDNGVCKMRAISESRGESLVEMPIVDGVSFSTTIDPQLLLDMLSRLNTDIVGDVSMEAMNNNTVCVFRHGDRYLYVLVPLTRS